MNRFFCVDGSFYGVPNISSCWVLGWEVIYRSMDNFHRYMALRYMILLKGLELANIASCQFFQDVYSDLTSTIRGFTAIGTGGDDFVRYMVVAVESVIQP